MRRSKVSIAVFAALAVAAGCLVAPGAHAAEPTPPIGGDLRSSPPDQSRPSRPATPDEARPRARVFAPIANDTALRDVIVSNTNTALATGGGGGSEPSIAINPANPDEIVISSFFGGWGTNTSVFHSTDGGDTWTVLNTIPAPPGLSGVSGCPCDQTFDFGRDGTLYGTFLLFDGTNTNVVTGSTTDITQASSWSWNGNPAQLTNQAVANNADQPWLLVNRDPVTASQDNAYVAYDEFTNNLSRVSVSTGTTPVAIARDQRAGNASPNVTNPGLRLASDPRNGTMYALYQTSTGASQPRNVTYHLNRSTDGGQTWTLNGNVDGIAVDNVPSSQLQFKFAGVNDLRGGVDHAAVDPTNGDVYVVYGHDTNSTGTGNQLEIRRITTDNTGTATVGAASVVSNAASAALPSVAVAADGTIGVLYDTDDGTNASGFPIISAHFARSTDHGVTFTDQVLQTFNSPVLPSGSNTDRQRILGDYQQLKALGRTFFAVYSGNRTGFGSTISAIDPVFASISVRAASTTTLTSSTNPSVFGQPVTFTATVTSAAGTPTGNVTFAADGTPLGTVALAGGQATVTTSGLAVGAHTITADYEGDVNSTPSSDSLTQTVERAPTTTTLTSTPNPSTFGQPTTLTATVTVNPPGAGTPTGTVTFRRGAVVLGATTLGTSGLATLTVSGLQVGTNSLTASYSGDGNFLPSTSDALDHVVACTTNLTGVINGGLTVTGSTCLTNATVNGATTVRPGGALSIRGSRLNGSLTSTNANALTICASSVGRGSSLIIGTAGFVLLGDNGDDGTPACAGNQFAGSLTLDANTGQAELGGNTFRGSVTVNNTSGTGPDAESTTTEIEANTITGKLACTGNVPPPTNDGQPNNVGGSRRGQCAAANF